MDQPLHFYFVQKTAFKTRGFGFSRRNLFAGEDRAGRAVNSRGGSAGARPRSPPPRDAPRHACAAPRLTRRRLAARRPRNRIPFALAGSATGRGLFTHGRHLDRQPSPCDPQPGRSLGLCPAIRPSVYISSGGWACGVLSCLAMGAMDRTPEEWCELSAQEKE